MARKDASAKVPPSTGPGRPTLPEGIAASWVRELPDLDQHALAVTLRIRALALVIDHEVARLAGTQGIQTEDVLLLSALQRTGPPYRLRPTEIFKLLNITSGAATARIARLVKKGLARRIVDVDDRRSALVQITAAGTTAIGRIMQAAAAMSDRALIDGGIDEARLRQLKTALTRLERGWESVVPLAENPLARQQARPHPDA